MWQVKREEKPEYSLGSWSSRVNSATIYWNELEVEEIDKERNQDLVCGPVEFIVNVSVWGFKEEMSASLLIIQMRSTPAYPIWQLVAFICYRCWGWVVFYLGKQVYWALKLA